MRPLRSAAPMTGRPPPQTAQPLSGSRVRRGSRRAAFFVFGPRSGTGNRTMMTGDWLDIGALADIPLRGARTVPLPGGEEAAVFRTGENQVYALINRCPHKKGPLSQGIVH